MRKPKKSRFIFSTTLIHLLCLFAFFSSHPRVRLLHRLTSYHTKQPPNPPHPLRSPHLRLLLPALLLHPIDQGSTSFKAIGGAEAAHSNDGAPETTAPYVRDCLELLWRGWELPWE
ncbi:hypothetical protein Droror1_Dr00002203, partial [Drosera rotundifolia]